MSVQVRRRREAAGFLSSYVGAQGELLVDTTNNRVSIQDGTTPGGFPAARLNEVAPNGLAPFTVANLPSGVEGQAAFASNGLKAGEIAGAGTGVPVYFSNGLWRRYRDDAAVTA